MGPSTLELVDLALAEDVGAGDLTSAATVDEGALARAEIVQKAEGLIAGLDVAATVLARVDPALELVPATAEGVWRDGGPVAAAEGRAHSLLAAERVALNFLGRLSGVATLTARYVRAVEGTGARILHTRKTTPGLRELERRAVLAGGGASHRAGLYDAILVKENHARLAGGVGRASRLALAAAGGDIEVVVECESLREVADALDAGVPRVLLDEMTVEEVREAAAMVAGRALIEVSGSVGLDGARALAEAGADLISVGALTHSAPALDLSLGLERL